MAVVREMRIEGICETDGTHRMAGHPPLSTLVGGARRAGFIGLLGDEPVHIMDR
jgi:hypothetical protein